VEVAGGGEEFVDCALVLVVGGVGGHLVATPISPPRLPSCAAAAPLRMTPAGAEPPDVPRETDSDRLGVQSIGSTYWETIL